MNYYISNGTFYAVPANELYHYGVKGMKWGRRKARPIATGNARRSSNSTDADQNAQREARKAKAKKAAKVGAVVVGTALAAYGGYKLAKYAQNKRNQAAMKKASDYINKNFLSNVETAKFVDGTQMKRFQNNAGTEIVTRGSRDSIGKAIGKMNAKTVAEGKQIYKNATNTRLDRGLNKVVNAGDAVGNAAKRATSSAGNAAKRATSSAGKAATKAKNSILDVVNPLYDYVPGESRTVTRNYGNGINYTKTITDYNKVRRKR